MKTAPMHGRRSPAGEESGAPRRLTTRLSQAPRDIEGRIGGAIDRLYGCLEANPLTKTPWAVIQVVSQSQGALLAGSMAYYTFLSLVPLLMVAAFVVSAVANWNVDVHDAVVEAMERLVPTADGARLLRELFGTGVALGLVALATLAYAGSGFVGALTASLNRMWGVEAGRNPVVQKVVNVSVAATLGAVLVGSVGATLWVAYVAEAVFGNEAGSLLTAIDWLAAPLSLFVVLVLLYRLLPARPLSWGSQLPGAAAAALGIEVLKRGFALWATHSAGLSVLPRSLLSVVLLLVWFGFVSQVILYGAAINVVRERRRRASGLQPEPEAEDDVSFQAVDVGRQAIHAGVGMGRDRGREGHPDALDSSRQAEKDDEETGLDDDHPGEGDSGGGIHGTS